MSEDVILRVRGLTKHYTVSKSFLGRLMGLSRGVVHALDDVDLAVRRGEVFGVVGESGCGKTTLGRLFLRLIPPTRGTIEFNGRDLTSIAEHELRPLRRRMQLIFQDPHASLNPAMAVGDAIAHPLVVHGLADWKNARARAAELLEEVGLAPAGRFFDKRPAELSGGQKQRIVIARAVATRPEFVVADEPVSMLDMSVRTKILELLLDLKKKYDLTLVFITHDIATARFLCDRIAIMYLGQVVEVGDSRRILDFPEHPYAKALVAAVPEPDPAARRTEPVPRGEAPNAVAPPDGCRFHPRCPVATPACGHSGADLIDIVEERTGSAQGWRSAGPGSPAGPDALLSHAPPEAEARAREAVLAARPVVWDAVTGVTREGAALRVRFRVPEPIAMRKRPDGRETRCVLYEDVELL